MSICRMIRWVLSFSASLLLIGGIASAKPRVFEANAGRIIVVEGVIDGKVLRKADALVYLTKESKEPVTIVINSPGGSILAGMQFMSAMDIAKSRGVTLRCVVPMFAASMAFHILAACDERYALRNALFLWHGPRTDLMGTFTSRDLDVISESLTRFGDMLDPQLIKALSISDEEFYYYYHSDAILTVRDLIRLSVYFIKPVDDIKNFNENFFN